MRVAVCRPQVPFVRGGVEIFTDTLVEVLRVRGLEAEIVSLPSRTWPNDGLATNAMMWRLVDLGSDMEMPPDVVITTKFPSYLIRHPNKVVWLVHQLRQAYELHGTDLGQFSDSPEDRSIRQAIHDLDRASLGEARKLFATSQNVADRLHRSTGLTAEVLPHPPQELPYRCDLYGDFVLCVGRLDITKRIDLLLEAVALEPALEVVVVGDGPDRLRLEGLANRRVRFTGHVSAQELTDLYASCRAVFYGPIDEDFGMVPYEAFRAAKPVVTTSDAGGPLEVVRDGHNGRVVEPNPEAVAGAFARIARRRDHGSLVRCSRSSVGRCGDLGQCDCEAARMTLRDRVRVLLFFTPWVSAPLALLGGFLAIFYPLMQRTWIGWIIYGVGIAATVGFALRLRSRYRMSFLDSSPLGVVTWLQRRL